MMYLVSASFDVVLLFFSLVLAHNFLSLRFVNFNEDCEHVEHVNEDVDNDDEDEKESSDDSEIEIEAEIISLLI
jgi:hypothetical protein